MTTRRRGGLHRLEAPHQAPQNGQSSLHICRPPRRIRLAQMMEKLKTARSSMAVHPCHRATTPMSYNDQEPPSSSSSSYIYAFPRVSDPSRHVLKPTPLLSIIYLPRRMPLVTTHNLGFVSRERRAITGGAGTGGKGVWGNMNPLEVRHELTGGKTRRDKNDQRKIYHHTWLHRGLSPPGVVRDTCDKQANVRVKTCGDTSLATPVQNQSTQNDTWERYTQQEFARDGNRSFYDTSQSNSRSRDRHRHHPQEDETQHAATSTGSNMMSGPSTSSTPCLSSLTVSRSPSSSPPIRNMASPVGNFPMGDPRYTSRQGTRDRGRPTNSSTIPFEKFVPPSPLAFAKIALNSLLRGPQPSLPHNLKHKTKHKTKHKPH